jgi:uncharacterized membrane protein (DUF106 family)
MSIDGGDVMTSADLKNAINLKDCFTIIGLALLTNVFSELLSWIFIYRKKRFREVKKLIDSLTKKIDIKKESLTAKSRNMEKKIKQQESDLKGLNMEMMKIRMITTFIIGLFMVFFISLFNSMYYGVVVAKLPFEPFSFLSNVTHRGILSTDRTDCAFIFLFILSNFVIRPILQKILGVAPPRSSTQMPNFFEQMESK